MSNKFKKSIILPFKNNHILVVACLFLLSFCIFTFFQFNDKATSQAILPNCIGYVDANSVLNTNGTYNPDKCRPVACSTLTQATAKTPDSQDGYNCYYSPLKIPLPPCKTFVGDKKPRENCADLIDLPLYSAFLAADRQIGVNCVNECNEPDAHNNQINHNKTCINFCIGAAGENSDNCVKRNCHQLGTSDTPNSGNVNPNCKILDCSLLSLEELKTDIFRPGATSAFVIDPANPDEKSYKKYCEGNTKCYNFFKNPGDDSTNLVYIRSFGNNAMCKIHDCPPVDASCADDTLNIPKDSDYVHNYKFYINSGADYNSGFCKKLECPIFTRSYMCLDSNQEPNGEGSTLNSNCDTGSRCDNVDGKQQCTKTINCTIEDNKGEPECIASDPENADVNNDIFNAWFNRPSPPNGDKFNPHNIHWSDVNNKKESEMCYFKGNMEDNGWGYHPNYTINIPIIGTITVDLGYYHSDVRSPNYCTSGTGGAAKLGLRGRGYENLCGTGHKWKNPDEDVGYIKGIVSANYDEEYAEYKVIGCLRYKNSGALNACGARECRIDCSLGICKTQWCGFDVCRELKISMKNPDRCSMKLHSDLFERSGVSGSGNGDQKYDTVYTDADGNIVTQENALYTRYEKPGCISYAIDSDVRLRARKYGRKICVFIDQKGATAYERKNFDGTETITGESCIDGATKNADGSCPDGYITKCVDGESENNGTCDGKDTNIEPLSPEKWRTVRRIQYKNTYIDVNGQSFSEQDCIKIPLRIGPPRFYNIGNNTNSVNLFEPILHIFAVNTKKGGIIALPKTGEFMASTDFFQPEIVVKFGSDVATLSLDANKYGIVDAISDPNSKVTLNSNMDGLIHQATVFIAKEYDKNKDQPILCLYRHYTDIHGKSNDVKNICINRLKPEIYDNSVANQPVKMLAIISQPDVANIINPTNLGCEKDANSVCTNNVRNQVRVKIQLIADKGLDNQNNNCLGDDICTNIIELKNNNTDDQFCSNDIEKGKFCSKRDDCSKLVYECANNQIDINNSIAQGNTPDDSNIKLKEYCSGELLNNCNKKLGINQTVGLASDFFSQLDLSKTADMNYQNFLELFNTSTNNKITSGTANRYGWFNEICIAKGFESKLRKIIAYKTIDGVLGKCITDMTKNYYGKAGEIYANKNCNAGGKAPFCTCLEDKIHNLDEIFTLNGVEYIARMETPREAGLCLDVPLPQLCHPINYNTPDPDPSIDNSVALTILSGYNDANGVSTSHQSRFISSATNHAEYSATLPGSINVAGQCLGFWKESQLGKPLLNCEMSGQWSTPRNSCVQYSCPAISTALDIDNNGNYQNGYATEIPTTPETTQSTKGYNNGFAVWNSLTKTNDFLQTQTATSCLTGFKPIGGTLPTRYCKQNGQWDTTIYNRCERISCPAINQNNDADWLKNNGGILAVQSIYASRSSNRDESKTTATCNNQEGYWQIGANQPTLSCNHLGQWKTDAYNNLVVENPCRILECAEITTNSSSESDGFALWSKSVVSNNNYTSSTCKTDYAINPNQVYDATEFRPAGKNIGNPKIPTRKCEKITVNGNPAESWGATSNPCINKCPSSTTREIISTGRVTIQWLATDFGKYATVENCDTAHNASSFAEGRTNGCYKLRRFCGDGSTIIGASPGITSIKGKWYDPEPMCMGNNGQVGNATYNNVDGLNNQNEDSLPVDGQNATGTCIAGYGKSPISTSPAPQRQCVYASGNNIDEVYWKLTNNTQDCIQLCSVSNGQDFGNSTYSGTANDKVYPKNNINTIDINTIDLTCKTGMLNAVTVTGGPRSNNPPTATCQANGAWVVNNDCSPPRGCDRNSEIVNRGTNNNEIDDGKCQAKITCLYVKDGTACRNGIVAKLQVPPFTLSDTSDTIFCINDENGSSNKMSGRIKITCNDGRNTIISQCFKNVKHYYDSWHNNADCAAPAYFDNTEIDDGNTL